MDIDKVVQEKIDADADFQASLTALPEDERDAALSSKRKEVLSAEVAALAEKAGKADKAEELANNYKARAEKAEGRIKSDSESLSPKDAMLLSKADVDLDDVDEVVEYAKFKKISIADALKSPVLTGIIAERKEERATAAATAIGKNQRTNAGTSEREILANASKGQVPDDDEGIAKLVEARQAAKRVK